MKNTPYSQLIENMRNEKKSLPDDFWDNLEPNIPTYGKDKRIMNAKFPKYFLLFSSIAFLVVVALLIPKYYSAIDNNQLTTNENLTNISNSENDMSQANSFIASDNQPENIEPADISKTKFISEPKSKEVSNASHQKGNNNQGEKGHTNTFSETITSNIIILSEPTKPEIIQPQATTSISIENKESFDRSLINQLSIPFYKPNFEADINQFRLPDEVTECFSFSHKSKSFWFLELDALATFNQKNYKDSSASEVSSLLKLRKETESALFSYGFGLKAGVILPNNLVIRGGAYYHFIREYFDYYGDTTLTSTTDGIRQGIHIVKTTNVYKTLDAELDLGYRFNFGRIQLEPSLGVSYNFSLNRKGNILNNSFKPDSISTNTSYGDQIFKSNEGLGIKGELSLHYYFDARTSAYATIQYKRYFNNWMKPEYPIDIRYNHFMLGIGVRRFF